MRGRRIAWLAVLTVLAVPVAPAAAQPQPDEEIEPAPAGDPEAPPAPVKDPKLAKKWLDAGKLLLQKGDTATRAKRADDAKQSYENAVTAFEKSIESGEDITTHALLAEAHDKLGRHDLAVKHYRVVAKAQAGVPAPLMKKVTAKLDELAMKVGLVTLTVKPEGATISLGGTELGKAPLPEALVLLPGTYTVAFQAEGFQPREAELNVEAGSESERTIELEPIKVVVQEPEKDDEPVLPPPPPPRPSRLPLYAGGAAAAALLGVGAVTGILAVGRHGTFTSADATATEREDARSSGKTLALVTDVTLVGGVAAAGFTAYWYFFKYRPALQKPAEQRPAAVGGVRARRDAAQSAKVDLIPWVQSDASGLTLVGAF